MLTLRDVKLEDRDYINKRLAQRSGKNCELSFGNMFIWRCGYDIRIADYEPMLLISMEDDEGQYFLAPAGDGDMAKAVDAVAEYFAADGRPARFSCVSEEDLALIEAACPGRFTARHMRDSDDYLHLTASLAELKGKPFHGKRGHVNKFKASFSFEYVSITPELIPSVLELNEIWCKQHSFSDKDEDEADSCATRKLFGSFEQLGAIGGAILVDGKMAGFSAGTPRFPGSDTFIVHLEKGLIRYEGIYSAINNMFMTDIMERGFVYADREEDMGIPGLRKSKLSYNPEIILAKYELIGR